MSFYNPNNDTDDQNMQLKSIENCITNREDIKNNSEDINSPNTIKDSDTLCEHEVVIHDICVNCLKKITQISNHESVSAGFISNEQGFMLSKNKAVEMENSWLNSLLKTNKLCLILDLDNTLIHASSTRLPADLPIPLLYISNNNSIYSDWMYEFDLSKGYPHYADDNDHEALSQIKKIEKSIILVELEPGLKNGTQLYIKLRPNVISFLRSMSKIFELFLFTMGTEEHALSSLRILDPDRKFFGHRVFSRNDGFQGFKSLKRIFPFKDGMVIIIDDTESVWGNLDSCIKVHGYYFFPMINTLEQFQNSFFITKTRAMLQSFSHYHSPSIKSVLFDQFNNNWAPSSSVINTIFPFINDSQNVLFKKRKLITQNNSISSNFKKTYSDQQDDIKIPTLQVKDKSENTFISNISTCRENNESILPVFDIIEYDAQLPYLAELLLVIHKLFFTLYNNSSTSSDEELGFPNVSFILNYLRREVLRGIILNSNYFDNDDFKLENTDLGRIAKNFGISLSKNEDNSKIISELFSDELIPNIEEKIPNILETSKKQILLMWLEYAIYTWRLPDKNLFLKASINPNLSSFWEITKDQPIIEYDRKAINCLLRINENKNLLSREIKDLLSRRYKINSKKTDDTEDFIQLDQSSDSLILNKEKSNNNKVSLESQIKFPNLLKKQLNINWDQFWNDFEENQLENLDS